MSHLRTFISIIVARFVRFALRIMKKGATTLPGRVALKIQPHLIQILSKDKQVIIITGTNGKTTTTHMISETMQILGYAVITNVSGANLATGIASTLIEGIPIYKKSIRENKKAVYVLEMDEAAFSKTNASLNPKVHVVTNLFRDQLDRYGEITYTRDLISNGLKGSDGIVLLNTDDSMVASLVNQGSLESLPKKAKTDESTSSADFSSDVAYDFNQKEGRFVFFGMNTMSMFSDVSKSANSEQLNASKTKKQQSNNVTNIDKQAKEEIISDAAYCIYCKAKYMYHARSFGHLGDFYCPSCGFHRTEPAFSFSYFSESKDPISGKKITPSDPGFPVELHYKNESYTVRTTIPGVHNFYNLSSAVSACTLFGEVTKDRNVSFSAVCNAVQKAKPAFGRMEKIKIGNKYLCLLLVKNPVGLERALSFVSEASDAGGLYFLLNSNDADGKDVSWIWDVDFESRKYPKHVFVSGERYGDMYLRLYYAGVPEKEMEISPMETCAELMEKALAQCKDDECLYILPNYTSMLHLRKIMADKYGLKAFWK